MSYYKLYPKVYESKSVALKITLKKIYVIASTAYIMKSVHKICNFKKSIICII